MQLNLIKHSLYLTNLIQTEEGKKGVAKKGHLAEGWAYYSVYNKKQHCTVRSRFSCHCLVPGQNIIWSELQGEQCTETIPHCLILGGILLHNIAKCSKECFKRNKFKEREVLAFLSRRSKELCTEKLVQIQHKIFNANTSPRFLFSRAEELLQRQ